MSDSKPQPWTKEQQAIFDSIPPLPLPLFDLNERVTESELLARIHRLESALKKTSELLTNIRRFSNEWVNNLQKLKTEIDTLL